MKPILHGWEQLKDKHVEKIPSVKVNVALLIQTFEANVDKAVPKDWSIHFKPIAYIYRKLFFVDHLPDEEVLEFNPDVFEMAEECLGNDELLTLVEKPKESGDRNYYYEFARSIAVEKMASELKEHLGEDCEFI